MTSDVQICNLALGHIGEAPIADLGQKDAAGKACKRNFDPIRDEVVQAFPWSCAAHRVLLAEDKEAPAFGYQRRFLLPADYLQPGPITDSGEPDGYPYRWKREGRFILTDAPAPLKFIYTRRVTDPTLFDPLLVSAISYRLASALATPLKASEAAAQRMMALYRDVLETAKWADSQQESATAAKSGSIWDSRNA